MAATRLPSSFTPVAIITQLAKPGTALSQSRLPRVGEAPIIPPLAAVGSAISNAIGFPVTDLPCSPPSLLAPIKRRASTKG